jgi:hypothetical protein
MAMGVGDAGDGRWAVGDGRSMGDGRSVLAVLVLVLRLLLPLPSSSSSFPVVVWQHPHLPLRAVARRLGGGAISGWEPLGVGSCTLSL